MFFSLTRRLIFTNFLTFFSCIKLNFEVTWVSTVFVVNLSSNVWLLPINFAKNKIYENLKNYTKQYFQYMCGASREWRRRFIKPLLTKVCIQFGGAKPNIIKFNTIRKQYSVFTTSRSVFMWLKRNQRDESKKSIT